MNINKCTTQILNRNFDNFSARSHLRCCSMVFTTTVSFGHFNRNAALSVAQVTSAGAGNASTQVSASELVAKLSIKQLHFNPSAEFSLKPC
jgi:hypothetical protein